MFFSAINCEDFEIKAKIRVENQLFHTFHRAHRIPEVFLHDICQNSFSCDSPFNLMGDSALVISAPDVLG